MKIMYDTGALISLFDKTRERHEKMLAMHESILSDGKSVILLSPIVLSEYGVKGDALAVLKQSRFVTSAYNERHAIEAARLKKSTMFNDELRSEANTRFVIINDTQIIAQANIEGVDYVLTEDQNTFFKTAKALKDSGLIATEVLSLRDIEDDFFGGMKNFLAFE